MNEYVKDMVATAAVIPSGLIEGAWGQITDNSFHKDYFDRVEKR